MNPQCVLHEIWLLFRGLFAWKAIYVLNFFKSQSDIVKENPELMILKSVDKRWKYLHSWAWYYVSQCISESWDLGNFLYPEAVHNIVWSIFSFTTTIFPYFFIALLIMIYNPNEYQALPCSMWMIILSTLTHGYFLFCLLPCCTCMQIHLLFIHVLLYFSCMASGIHCKLQLPTSSSSFGWLNTIADISNTYDLQWSDCLRYNHPWPKVVISVHSSADTRNALDFTCQKYTHQWMI